MLTHPTLEKLQTLRLSGMLKALSEQQQMPEIGSLGFEERLGLLIDREVTERENRRLETRLKKAKLRHSCCLEDLDVKASRGLDKTLILTLAACTWIARGINLLICQMVALNRVQKSVKAMIGVVISEATLLKFVRRLHESLADWELLVAEQLIKSAAINVDETSLRVEQKNHWIHVYSAGDMTLKYLHRKRGKEAIESINIIPRYGGVIIHDCWSSYLSYNHCTHGLCGSHLLRELAFVIDANGYRWATP